LGSWLAWARHADGLWLFTFEQARIVYMHTETELLGLEGHFLLGCETDGRLLSVAWLIVLFLTSHPGLLVQSISGDIIQVLVAPIKEYI